MANDAKAVANFLLERAKKENDSLTPMKLQKLVYYAHGWHLALANTPLIDEQVEAWKHGPVIRTLYNTFRDFGANEITGFAEKVIWMPGRGLKFRVTHPKIATDGSPETTYARSLLDRIWDVYNPLTAYQLSNMTHEPGTPWDRVYKKYDGKIPKGTDIPEAWIKEYFLELAEQKA